MSHTVASAPELVLSPSAWTDQTNGMRMFCDTRLSINQLTTHHWALRADLMQYRRLGVGGIGLNRWKLEQYTKRDYVSLIRDSGLRPTSVSFAGGYPGQNGFSFPGALFDTKRAVDMAHRVGCETVIVTTGRRGLNIKAHALRNTRDALLRSGDYAFEKGIQLALMPMRDQPAFSMIRKLDDALSLLDFLDHPALKLAFHTYHLGTTPDIVDRIPGIARFVASVHVSDYVPFRQPFDQRVPGAGILPLPQIIRAFDKAGYGGAYEINIWSERLWKSNYSDLLADCIRHFHEVLRNPRDMTS